MKRKPAMKEKKERKHCCLPKRIIGICMADSCFVSGPVKQKTNYSVLLFCSGAWCGASRAVCAKRNFSWNENHPGQPPQHPLHIQHVSPLRGFFRSTATSNWAEWVRFWMTQILWIGADTWCGKCFDCWAWSQRSKGTGPCVLGMWPSLGSHTHVDPSVKAKCGQKCRYGPSLGQTFFAI